MVAGSNRQVRLVVYQMALGVALCAGVAQLYMTLAENLKRRNIGGGFGFLMQEAGFSIGEVTPLPVFDARTLGFCVALTAAFGLFRAGTVLLDRQTHVAQGPMRVAIALAALAATVVAWRIFSPTTFLFSAEHNYLTAIAAGIANTVKVAVVGVFAATCLGVLVGLARLSPNRLLSSLAAGYVEFFRNIPLLVQIFFWYFAVLRTLPGVRDSVWLFDIAALNNRGVYLTSLHPTATFAPFATFLLVGLLLISLAFGVYRQPRSPARTYGPQAFVVGVLLACAWALFPVPITIDKPSLSGFNIRGGSVVTPEYAALLFGVTAYTAAFIAEIVRGGVLAVGRGQWEAAQALGLSRLQMLRLIIAPQALRTIFPPLITQYLSLTKDTSLGVAIGYPELVSVTGTIINQTGQAIEMLVITLIVYSSLSLGISAFINWRNRRAVWATYGR